MKEYNLWLNLKRNLAAPLWQRIETGGTGRGIPDVFGAYKGVCCWVELKIARGNKVHLTPEQTAWLIKFARAEVRTFILVGTNKKTMYLFSGNEAREVLDHGIKHRPLLKLKTPYEWKQLEKALYFTKIFF
jgi:Holliday junction resolvase|tara:strand:+ start:823 stop:1215 length:393 start_codon:yes stop_codon:yes gene_type:complete